MDFAWGIAFIIPVSIGLYLQVRPFDKLVAACRCSYAQLMIWLMLLLLAQFWGGGVIRLTPAAGINLPSAALLLLGGAWLLFAERGNLWRGLLAAAAVAALAVAAALGLFWQLGRSPISLHWLLPLFAAALAVLAGQRIAPSLAGAMLGLLAADLLSALYLGYQAQLADVAGATTLNYICLTCLCCCGWLAAGRFLALGHSKPGEVIDFTHMAK